MDCFASFAMKDMITISMALKIIEGFTTVLAAPQRLAGGGAEFGKQFVIF